MLRLVKLRLARDSAFMNTQKNYLYPKNGYVLNFGHFNSLFTSSTLELPHEEVTIGGSGHVGLQDDATNTHFKYAK